MKQDLRTYELQGLCMTCDHAGGCAYLARAGGPIWSCEEFDDSGQATLGPSMMVAPPPSRPGTGYAHAEDREPFGLCRNCENRSFCALPCAREGVLFCEEYR